MYFDQVEVLCNKKEMNKALEYLAVRGFKVQVITYNQMVNNGGRSPGVRIIASREIEGQKAVFISESEV